MDEWKRRIDNKDLVVGVLGLGYVGLPLAREFASAGLKVLGFDVDERKVQILNSGRSIIKHVPHSQVKQIVKKGLFRATCKMSQLNKPDAILICVPTPLTENREPDVRFIVSSSETIAKYLRPGQLIVLESTTYPGTTSELMVPILESSGLKAGKDFHLAYSPEREDPGNPDFSTKTIPKVVGGLTKKCRDMACQLYGAAIVETVPVSSLEAAEAAKILENVYRCVNIAMVNELKIVFDKMDIDLTWKARQYGIPTRFIELAGEINTSMPQYVVTKTMEALNERCKSLKGSKVLVLGLAYKKDIDDLRESPSIELIELFRKKGAKVDYNDPFIPRTHKQRQHDLKMVSKKLSAKMLAGYDVVLISTDHSDYDYTWIVQNAKLVVDARNATAAVRGTAKKVVKAE